MSRLCLLAVFVLAACADEPRVVPQASQPALQYKVGKPYQIDGTWYYPQVDYEYAESGEASWYGDEFHGRPTANGEIFDKNKLTAAHRTLPLPSFVLVTNTANGRSVVLRVNDRGPFARNRIIDVSRRAAQELGFLNRGTAQVKVKILPEESRQIASLGQRDTLSDAERATAAPVTVVSSAVLAPPPGANAAPPAAASQTGGSGAGVAAASLLQGAMYVQAASFGEYRNAADLAERLGRLGPTRVVTVRIDGRDYHRVLVGPANDQDAASMLLAHVQRAGLADARIVRSESL